MPSIVCIGALMGRALIVADWIGLSRLLSESPASVGIAAESCSMVEFRLIASDALELSRAGIGGGTEGNASKIESPSKLCFVAGETGVSQMSSLEVPLVADGTNFGSSATVDCTTGNGGGGPDGGGRGGGSSTSDFFLPETNHEARLCFGLPDAVELLRFLRPPSFSGNSLSSGSPPA